MTTMIDAFLGGRPFHVIAPDASLHEAAGLLCARSIGALAVMEGGALRGILSERDIIRRGVCAERDLSQMQVSEAMTPDPVTVEADQTMADALRAMERGGFRHVIVRRGGEAVAMLSMRDIPLHTRRLVAQARAFKYSKPRARVLA